MGQLRSIAGRYEIECEQIYAHEPTVGRLLDNKQAEHLIKVIEQIYEGVSCAPYLMLAASDSHHFSQLTDKVFKFTPFHLTKELRGGIHGIDEKLPTAELARAVMFYEELLRSLPSF
jgi:carboxypeptidase PM20D1